VRTLFADAQYWIALLNPRDRHHHEASTLRIKLQLVPLLTTDGVLGEILAFCSDRGAFVRKAGVTLCRNILENPGVEVVAQNRSLVLAGLDLYEQRPDKEYSLVDCISMCLMRERGVYEVLTYDHHFAQEGFLVMLRDQPS